MTDDDRCHNCGRRFDHPNQYTWKTRDGKPAQKDPDAVRVCRRGCGGLMLDQNRLEAWELAVKDWA